MQRLSELLTDHTRLVVKLIILTFVFGQMASAALTNRYVDKASAIPSEPYDTWGNAAISIQTAIDYARAGETVLVAAATYDTGGVTNYPSGSILTNRVAIWKAITVRSADNDPANTIIVGAKDADTTNGPTAVRCVYITNAAALIGFTLTNGATQTNSPISSDKNGGGVRCHSTNTIISNCVIIANSASYYGGGTYYGSLYNCTLITNIAGSGGGSSYGNLFNCTLSNNVATGTLDGSAQICGGAAHYCTLYNCMIVANATFNAAGRGGGTVLSSLINCSVYNNTCPSLGGGAYGYASDVTSYTLKNCTLIGNRAAYGAGAYSHTLYNCLVVSNSASGDGGGTRYCNLYNSTVVSNYAATGGGVRYGTLANCIVYFNTAANWDGVTSFTNTCTMPAASSGTGNITNNPQFVNTNVGNYRLSANSPCVNTGTNGSWTTTVPYDLDGRARIRYGTVDMGAYERICEGTIYSFH